MGSSQVCNLPTYWFFFKLSRQSVSLVPNMKRPSRIQVINAVLFLALFVLFFIFYLKDQTTKFIQGSTTFASRTEKVDKFRLPFLVFCFEPGYKPSIYENNTADLTVHFVSKSIINEEQKMWDFLKSASYKLDED